MGVEGVARPPFKPEGVVKPSQSCDSTTPKRLDDGLAIPRNAWEMTEPHHKGF